MPISYLVFLLLGITFLSLLYWYAAPPKHRNKLLLGTSICLIGGYNLGYLIYLFFNLILVYAGALQIRKGNKLKLPLFQFILLWLVVTFCLFKYFPAFNLCSVLCSLSIFRSPTDILFPLGLSYIFFRLIHYTIESYRNVFPAHSFLDFVLYVLFFPTFLSGPVERFQTFLPQINPSGRFELAQAVTGMRRILTGLIKKFLIADTLVALITPTLVATAEHSWLAVVLSIYGLSVLIYMDFSGYTDIALGISRLFGFKIMENFHKPFLQENIVLFWRNWHISIYSWIRDYFFLPLFGKSRSVVQLYLGIFLSMFLFNIWHGGTINFVLSGIYHSCGVISWHIFQKLKRKYLFLGKLTAVPGMKYIAIFSTITFFSAGLVFFNYDLPTILAIFHKLFFLN